MGIRNGSALFYGVVPKSRIHVHDVSSSTETTWNSPLGAFFWVERLLTGRPLSRPQRGTPVGSGTSNSTQRRYLRLGPASQPWKPRCRFSQCGGSQSSPWLKIRENRITTASSEVGTACSRQLHSGGWRRFGQRNTIAVSRRVSYSPWLLVPEDGSPAEFLVCQRQKCNLESRVPQWGSENVLESRCPSRYEYFERR
jgi:hypothetical protein